MNNNSHSDYWLDDINELNQLDEHSDTSIDLDMIRLASARRAISNFVQILTNIKIPVYFNVNNLNLTDGKSIYLCSNIKNKEDFDPSVGLALHEAGHILLTDFDILKTLWMKIPKEIYDISDSINISKELVIDTVKDVLNIIEDRYIDNFVFKTAPGYRGYYIALYNKYFNHSSIDKMLKSNMYRTPSINAYISRIVNFTNINTDLNALPDLKLIAELINIKNIDRLKMPQDRFDVAIEVSKVIFKNIAEYAESNKKEMPSPDSINNSGNETVNSQKDNSNKSDNVLGGDEISLNTDNTNDDTQNNDLNVKNGKGDISEISPTKLKKIEKVLDNQKKFLNGKINKKKVSAYQKTLLDSIEKSGMLIEKVGKDLVTNNSIDGIDCIVVKNLTKEVILSDGFPLKETGYYDEPMPFMKNVINSGIIMGNKLGRMLLLRNESNITKHMRKNIGKLDKRIIFELGCNNENIFYHDTTDKYNNSFIHISVDASSSMNGQKWYETMKTITAICKACSMIENIRVSVSFRTTIFTSRNNTLPYIILAYDSSKDKFSKIINLFPYLLPSGTTPEGLAYEATLKLFDYKNCNDNSYFLNFSDGEPYMNCTVSNVLFSYVGDLAVNHTKKQINKIKEKGYNILSYYINEFGLKYNNFQNLKNDKTYINFKKMYGEDAVFISPSNINSIAKSLNELFLKKSEDFI